MTPHDALAAGDLTAAIEIARESADPAARLLVAELLGVAGDYDAALLALVAIESGDANWPAARREFRRTLRAAARRRDGRRSRRIDLDPPHLRHRMRAYRIGSTEPELATRHIDQADRLAPDLVGHDDGREFQGLRDADDIFGSVLELFVEGRWDWIGWESVARLEVAPAVGMLDFAFRAAELTLHDGREFSIRLPVIYPHASETEDVFKLGLETDFASENGGPVRGVGARLLRLGDDEIPLDEIGRLDIRRRDRLATRWRLHKLPHSRFPKRVPAMASELQATQITYHPGSVTREERTKVLGQLGATIWFTGLSGSGKSTLAVALEQVLIQRGQAAYALDGDNVRFGLNAGPKILAETRGYAEESAKRFGLAFSAADREENIRRIGEVAKLFADAGLFALTSFISPYRKDREAARKAHAEAKPAALPFIEIYVNTPIETCEQRDPKGLYKPSTGGGRGRQRDGVHRCR